MEKTENERGEGAGEDRSCRALQIFVKILTFTLSHYRVLSKFDLYLKQITLLSEEQISKEHKYTEGDPQAATTIIQERDGG